MQYNMLYCKKDFCMWKNHPLETRIFKEGRIYKYKEEYNGDFFIYYNENHTDSNKRGYRFYTGSIEYIKKNHVNDYFCTLQEYRKLKLQKLNNEQTSIY